MEKIPEIKIEWIDITLIKPYDKNAKLHPKKQVKQIAQSIKEFGFLVPILVDQNNELIAGHGRMLAAELLALHKVPTVKAEHLTPEQIKAYRLADNKLNESDWDMDLVISELKELSLPMLDLTGFSRDLILDEEDKDDVVPAAPATPRSKLGDFYILGGKHRLICGDSCKSETYKNLLGGGITADMVFTDPPYNVAYRGDGKNTDREIENDDMDTASFTQFLGDFFKSSETVVKNGAGWYVFHSSSTQDQFKIAMEEAGLVIRTQLIWNKPTASMGWGDYRWKHEPFYYAGKPGKLVFYGDRTHKTVVDFHASEKELIAWVKREKRLETAGLSSVWTMKRDPVNEYVHPTQKPVELITYAMVNSSKAGDIVLDPFAGSGSVIIASEKCDRIGFCIELDPTFVDIIVQRYVDYTKGGSVTKNGEPDEWKVSTNIEKLVEGANSEADVKPRID